jgi:hypothetical protein
LKNIANLVSLLGQLSFVHSDTLPVFRRGFFMPWSMIQVKYLSSFVDNAQDTIPVRLSEEKCSTWNVFVEREYPFFSVCGKLFLFAILNRFISGGLPIRKTGMCRDLARERDMAILM